MNKTLALSLIIPAYNEERHLAACLDSIAAQTVMPDEVIVVDNNSIDRTREIARSYPFVRVVTERTQGIVYARDAGFNAAKYPLIGRIDSDSILPKNWVEYVMEFYADPGNQRVCLTGAGDYYNVPVRRVARFGFDLLAYRINRIALGHHFLFGSNMVIPKSVWQTVKNEVCLRNDIHEDVDLAIHVHRAGEKIIYDRKLKMGVKLRRVFQDHNKLWAVLMLWPQTYKVHGHTIWFTTGIVGASVMYALAPVLYPLKGLQLLRQRLFGKR